MLTKKFKNCVVCKKNLLRVDISHKYVTLINIEYVKEKDFLTYLPMCFYKYMFIETVSILNENISSQNI